MTGPMQSVAKGWPEGAPDWVVRLAEECAASSQNKVAVRLGRSAALVSQVLKNKYSGDLAAVEELVRGVFMAATIECPALGRIPSNECQKWRAKARRYSPANMMRVNMYRACTRCPRNAKEVVSE